MSDIPQPEWQEGTCQEAKADEYKSGGATPPFGNPQDHDNTCNYNTVCKYRLLNDAYTGEGLFSSRDDCKTAIIYSRGELLFQERLMRSFYNNLVAPFNDAKWRPVYDEQPPVTMVKVGETVYPSEEGESHYFLDWTENVDQAGTSYNQLKQNVLHGSWLLGVNYLVMDKSEGLNFPVCYVQTADTVDPFSIEVDRFGKIIQIGFYEVHTDIMGNPQYMTRFLWRGLEVVEQKTASTKLEDADWEDVRVSSVGIDEMPVLPVFSVPRMYKNDYLPTPVKVYGLAKASAHLFNVSSDYGWHMNRQAHSHMYTTADLESVRDGNTSVIKLENLGDGSTPVIGHVSADTGIATSHEKYEDKTIQKLIDLMAEDGVIITRGDMNVPESGVARSYRYRAVNTTLAKSVEMSRYVDKWVERIFQKYQGVEGNFEVVVRYKTDYNISEPLSVTDLMDILDAFTKAGVLQGAKETYKNLAEKMMGKNTDRIKDVFDDIEAVQLPREVAVDIE